MHHCEECKALLRTSEVVRNQFIEVVERLKCAERELKSKERKLVRLKTALAKKRADQVKVERSFASEIDKIFAEA
jgi:hypothetical protein